MGQMKRLALGLALLLGEARAHRVSVCVGASCPPGEAKAQVAVMGTDPEVASLETEVLRLRDELARLRVDCATKRRYYIKMDRDDKGLLKMEDEIAKLEWTLGGLRERSLRSYDDKVKADVESCRESIDRLEAQARSEKFNDDGMVETKIPKITTPAPEVGDLRYAIPEKKPVPKLPLGVRELVAAPKPKPPKLVVGKNPPAKTWGVNAPTEPPMGKLKVRLTTPCGQSVHPCGQSVHPCGQSVHPCGQYVHEEVVHEGVMNPKIGDYTMDKVYKSEVSVKKPCDSGK